MKALAILVSCVLLSILFVSGMTASRANPEVILLGSAHVYHFQTQMHYSLIDLKNEIAALQPNVVCGEITPEGYRNVMEGYFPPEAAYLAEVAPSLRARFVPADWRMADAWQSRAEKMVPKEKAAEEDKVEEKQKEGLEKYTGASVFDYLHSPAFIGLSDEKFEQVVGENTVSDLAYGAWHERNRKIVENCLEAAPEARRIVFVFGANHLAQLRRQLAARGITAQIAARRFTPAGMGAVPPAVLARWRKNLENMQGILAGSTPVSIEWLDRIQHHPAPREVLALAIKTYESASAGRSYDQNPEK